MSSTAVVSLTISVMPVLTSTLDIPVVESVIEESLSALVGDVLCSRIDISPVVAGLRTGCTSGPVRIKVWPG